MYILLPKVSPLRSVPLLQSVYPVAKSTFNFKVHTLPQRVSPFTKYSIFSTNQNHSKSSQTRQYFWYIHTIYNTLSPIPYYRVSFNAKCTFDYKVCTISRRLPLLQSVYHVKKGTPITKCISCYQKYPHYEVYPYYKVCTLLQRVLPISKCTPYHKEYLLSQSIASSPPTRTTRKATKQGNTSDIFTQYTIY